MITSSKCRPRNSAGRFCFTVTHYQTAAIPVCNRARRPDRTRENAPEHDHGITCESRSRKKWTRSAPADHRSPWLLCQSGADLSLYTAALDTDTRKVRGSCGNSCRRLQRGRNQTQGFRRIVCAGAGRGSSNHRYAAGQTPRGDTQIGPYEVL